MMRLKTLYLVFGAVLLLWTGCNNNDDELSIFPQLTVTGINRTSITQGSVDAPNQDLEISFTVTDGNGDFGIVSPLNNVFLTDTRDGRILQFGVYQSASGNPQIDAPFTVAIPNKPFNICCMYDDDTDDCGINPDVQSNSVVYTLQVRDFGGLVSNIVEIDPITILCE